MLQHYIATCASVKWRFLYYILVIHCILVAVHHKALTHCPLLPSLLPFQSVYLFADQPQRQDFHSLLYLKTKTIHFELLITDGISKPDGQNMQKLLLLKTLCVFYSDQYSVTSCRKPIHVYFKKYVTVGFIHILSCCIIFLLTVLVCKYFLQYFFFVLSFTNFIYISSVLILKNRDF